MKNTNQHRFSWMQEILNLTGGLVIERRLTYGGVYEIYINGKRTNAKLIRGAIDNASKGAAQNKGGTK